MALNNAQLTTLKADIIADPVLDAELQTSDGAFAIALAYNLLASPDYFVWRTDITQNDVNEAVDWDEVVGLTTNEMLAFQLLKNQATLNASLVNIRQAFTSIFPTNQQPNTNAGLVAVAKRKANRIEKLLAIGTGSNPSPSVMGFEGTIGFRDVIAARKLP